MNPEYHPFGTFFKPDSKILILGSFPCFNDADYGDWYYSGSGRNDLWPLLADIFAMKAETKNDKIGICLEHRIAMADIALRIVRTRGNCNDGNLKILEYNKSGIEECIEAGIKTVYFTGSLAEKHFFRIFPGSKVNTLRLPSPSPAAARYIAGTEEYKKMLAEGRVSSIYEYKLEKYKIAFKTAVSAKNQYTDYP